MELRGKKASALCLSLLAWSIPALPLDIPARHEHLRKGCEGTLQIDERGLRFTPGARSKKPHRLAWDWQDVQWLRLSAGRVRVLTYQDVRWKLGADRSHEFIAAPGHSFEPAYELLKDRLDQRFTAELADPATQPLWLIPVKRLGRLEGSEGVLKVGSDRVVYESRNPAQSMTWRYMDIRGIRSPDPFRLTLTGFRQEFSFQLKMELPEDRYDDLWRRVERAQGLKLPALAGGR